MNKRYEENRPNFFTNSGEKLRRQYVWAKDEKGEEYLQETEPIDIQQEIESYANECDIKNIVRKASFDPEFLKTLQDTAGAEMDVSNWPTNIHEYHQMIATAQATAMQLEKMEKVEQTVKTVEKKEKTVEKGENKVEQE